MCEDRDSITVQEFKERLKDWLAAFGVDHDVTFYSQSEWALRKENHPNIDSAFLHITNETILLSMQDNEYHDELGTFTSYWGWHFERGFAWSWHFWPLDAIEFKETRLSNGISVHGISVLGPSLKGTAK